MTPEPPTFRALARQAFHRWNRLRLLPLGHSPSWRRASNGMMMEIDPADVMDREFYLGTYEPALTGSVRRWVRPGDVCLDIGAQKGFVTLLLSGIVGQSGRVLAFEPDPRALERLQAHCRRNAADNVVVAGHALGREEGTAEFHLSSQLGWSSRFPGELARESIVRRISVRVASLDELIERGELQIEPAALRFVKIDIEGSEPLALEGMRGLLAAARPLVWCEINPGALRAAGSSFGTVRDLLRDLGYELFVPRSWHSPLGAVRFAFRTPVGPDAPSGTFDLAALKGGAELLRRAGIPVTTHETPPF